MQQFEQYVERIMTALDDMVADCSDDELFAGGYFRGHFALAASDCEQAGNTSWVALTDAIDHSLQAAFSAGELNVEDQGHVTALWRRLQQEHPPLG